MKNPFLCHVILFGEPFFKMILALKCRKLFDTTEAQKKKKKKIINIIVYISNYFAIHNFLLCFDFG